jgi:hypothetical protein
VIFPSPSKRIVVVVITTPQIKHTASAVFLKCEKEKWMNKKKYPGILMT